MKKMFAILAALMLLVSSWVMADNLTIQVSDGTTTVSCADGAACDSNALPGAVTFTNVFGTVSVGGTGFGSPALPTYSMDLNYALGGSSVAKTYTVAVSENDLPGGSPLSFTGQLGGTQSAGDSLTAEAWVGTNTLFSAGPGVCGPISTSASPFALTCSGSATPADPFALTEQVSIAVVAGAGTSTGDFNIGAVPEPGTIFLLGGGLIALALTKRKKL